MNSTAMGPPASKTSEENVLPVTVPILSLDTRLRGVVRGTSNVSLVIRGYLSELLERSAPACRSRQITPGTRDGRAGFGVMLLLVQRCAKCNREGVCFQ